MTLSKDAILKRKTEFKPCECGCGTTIPVLTSSGDPARFKRGHNPTIRPTNGRSIDSDGYVTLWKPDHHRTQSNGRVYEHIDVWERTHKASLLIWGIVHHKDHNKQNNEPSNLEAMMRSEHIQIHKPQTYRRNI